MNIFKKRFTGKWVLCGEYSVLRSCFALAYPLPHYHIDFSYSPSNTALQIKRKGRNQVCLDLYVAPLLDRALKKANRRQEDLKGILNIEGFILLKHGIRGSLCTVNQGMASLCQYKGSISKFQLKDFAISLENFLHGQSTGMEMSSVLEKKPILYQNGKVIQRLPKFKSVSHFCSNLILEEGPPLLIEPQR